MDKHNKAPMQHADGEGPNYSGGSPSMMPPPPRDYLQRRPPPIRTYSLESVSSYSDMEDASRDLSPQKRSQRSRKRLPASPEQGKHRRTRSGCYTCRQRRVKCDEARPICDRCRKGKRECTYPNTVTGSKEARTTVKSKLSSPDEGSSPSGDEADLKVHDLLPDNVDDESEALSASTERSLRDEYFVDEDSITPSSVDSTDRSSASARSAIPPANSMSENHRITPSFYQGARWLLFPDDVKELLVYHKEKLYHHHYALRSDPEDFLKTTFLEIAMNDRTEALLYAVVAFASYHRTFALEDSGMLNFLTYYNKSIVLLQQSLKRERPTITTLLAILQLATIEEFLGDWVTLIGHQKACCQILTDLFTPQSILQDPTRRTVIRWCIRFQLFAATMSGSETSLPREWIRAYYDYHLQETIERPYDLGAKYEEYFARNRLLASDFTTLMKAVSRGEVTDEQFSREGFQLVDRLTGLTSELDLACTSQTFANGALERSWTTEERLTSTDASRMFSQSESSTMNFVLLDCWSVELMIRQQILRQGPDDLLTIAMRQSRVIDAIELRNTTQNGAIIACQAGVGMASLFLPRERRYIEWARKKFAAIERKGYLFPSALREQMSALWGTDVRRSWLPDDENHSAALYRVREFIEYREKAPPTSFDTYMNGIFRNLYASARVATVVGMLAEHTPNPIARRCRLEFIGFQGDFLSIARNLTIGIEPRLRESYHTIGSTRAVRFSNDKVANFLDEWNATKEWAKSYGYDAARIE